MSALSSQSTSSASEVNAAGSDAELPETWSSDVCISSSDSYVSHEPEEPFLLSLQSEVDVPTSFSKLDNSHMHPALLPNQLSADEPVEQSRLLPPPRRRCIIS